MGDTAMQGAVYTHCEQFGSCVLPKGTSARGQLGPGIGTGNPSTNEATAAVEQKIFPFFWFVYMNFEASSTPISRLSHPGADEREGQDHPRATGLPVSEEGGREAVFSLLQAFNHLHQRFGGEAASHQGVRSQPHIINNIRLKLLLLCAIEFIFLQF